jgi:hypothetical protein
MSHLAGQLAAASEWARWQVQQSSTEHGKQGLMAAAHAAAAAAVAGLGGAPPAMHSSCSAGRGSLSTGNRNGSDADMIANSSSRAMQGTKRPGSGERPGSGQRPSSAGASRLWQAARREVCKNCSSTPGLRCRKAAAANGGKSMW